MPVDKQRTVQAMKMSEGKRLFHSLRGERITKHSPLMLKIRI